MKKKWVVLTICFVALAVSVLAFGSHPRTSQHSSPRHIPSQSNDTVREHVVYGFLFRQVVDLKDKAEKLESEKKDGRGLRFLYQRETNLAEAHARALDEIASACMLEVKQQDERAQKIIDAFRERYPPGKLPSGTTLPPPPPELTVMQEERNAIILRARDRLRVALGDQEFKRFDALVHRRIAANIKSS